MATVTKPMALDESINTTESTSRNIADVLAQELSGIASAITGGSDKANKTDIATVEPTNTASRAYSVGELVYVNGNLYKVKTDISQGSSFTVSTNIELTNVSERINDISAEDVTYGSGTVKDALDEITNKQVYSFFNDRAIVTKKGNIVVATLAGVAITHFKSGNTLVLTSFVDNYPELLPNKLALTCGFLYKSNSENYIATVEVNPNGKIAVNLKDAIATRTSEFTPNDYQVYGTISWITN